MDLAERKRELVDHREETVVFFHDAILPYKTKV